MIDTGEFREDLYYRLKGIILRAPTLAQRKTDIPLLASLFLRRPSHADARLTSAAQHWRVARDGKGNVRELRSAVECAAALALPVAVGEHAEDTWPTRDEHRSLALDQDVAALERLRIVEALERTARNHAHAARELGLSRVGLLKKMDRMGLR